jgi:hypothetical protein
MVETAWHIAQANVARAVAPLESAEMAEFMAALDGVNALAEASPGFVWRLMNDSGNATDIKVSDDPRFIVNMSVWASVEALFSFVYRSAHTKVMARRREWFEKPVEAYQVLWWVPVGHAPSPAEALVRLKHLQAHGASSHAFTFKERFPPPGAIGDVTDMRPEPYCVGWN